MNGNYGKIMTEKVKEMVWEARKTMKRLSLFVTAEDQIQLCKSIWAHLTPNCQTEADFEKLAEIKKLQEFDELVKTATKGQLQLINRLCGDLIILANYANGFAPTVKEPTRKQLLNLQFWSENIDIFADEYR